MSMKRPWYKRYPDHFIAGTIHLTFEQMAVYSLIIDLIHASDGRLKDDDRRIAAVLKLQPRRWKRLKNDLQTLGKLISNGEWIEFSGNISVISASQPIEKVRSTANKPIHREDKNKRKKKSISSSSSFSKSAGARAGEMEAPATPAPPEKKQADKTPQLSEEERAAFVRKILGREVLPGRVERPELHRLLEED
jgi:uncharacterized protein YdaU (DUF1376 family)